MMHLGHSDYSMALVKVKLRNLNIEHSKAVKDIQCIWRSRRKTPSKEYGHEDENCGNKEHWARGATQEEQASTPSQAAPGAKPTGESQTGKTANWAQTVKLMNESLLNLVKTEGELGFAEIGILASITLENEVAGFRKSPAMERIKLFKRCTRTKSSISWITFCIFRWHRSRRAGGGRSQVGQVEALDTHTSNYSTGRKMGRNQCESKQSPKRQSPLYLFEVKVVIYYSAVCLCNLISGKIIFE